MATETVTVKVEKGRVRQFKKMVESTGYAEITPEPLTNGAPPERVKTPSTPDNIALGNRKKGETFEARLKKVGTVAFNYTDANELRKAAWQRGKK